MRDPEKQVPPPSRSFAEVLNHDCYCRTLNADHLRELLERDANAQGLMQGIGHTRPHMFSSTAVFLTKNMAGKIADAVAAIERVIRLPGYVAQALSRAPEIANHAENTRGVCMGYDFHLDKDGPKLIEINTNAGGLLLNGALARAQVSCCEAMNWAFEPNMAIEELEKTAFRMFVNEWKLQKGEESLGLIAILDDKPSEQYLAPEFELFKQLFRSNGVEAIIVDPSELQYIEGKLLYGSQTVDMVYNRLTDFYLEESSHWAIRQAYDADAVVLTPSPHVYALYANKRNLIALSNDALLAEWGATQEDRATLKAVVPETFLVSNAQADLLWNRRKHLFFKPSTGYGAKAAYRGDKLTKRVWNEILAGDYVAQALVSPSERLIEVDGVCKGLKFDVRAYTYDGQIQLLAARMYTGQTTNFRTQGGGFAPVIIANSFCSGWGNVHGRSSVTRLAESDHV